MGSVITCILKTIIMKLKKVTTVNLFRIFIKNIILRKFSSYITETIRVK